MRLPPLVQKPARDQREIGNRRGLNRIVAPIRALPFLVNASLPSKEIVDTLPLQPSHFRSCLNIIIDVGGNLDFAEKESTV